MPQGGSPPARQSFPASCSVHNAVRSPKDSASIKACAKVKLYTPSEEQSWQSQVVHCKVEPNEGSQGVANPVWNEGFKLEANCHLDELAFIRIMVEDVGILRSTRLGVFCARVSHLTTGWRVVRLLAPSGVHTGTTIILNFSLDPA